MSFASGSSFERNNRGNQVGVNYGPINNTFHSVLPDQPRITPEPVVSIPFCRDEDFVNRGDVLERLYQICSVAPHRAALVGLGGVGKSQLAIEFAHRFRERSATNAWVFWVHASTRVRVEDGFRKIAEFVNLVDRDRPNVNVMQLVCQWLANERNGPWLMMLDSADDLDVLFGEQSPSSYLPQSSNGHVVLTTRNWQVADRLTGKRDRSIQVGPMSQPESMDLLKRKLGAYAQENWDHRVAGELVQALDLIPLAISQAAAYIQARAPRTSLVQYLQDFKSNERKRTKLLAFGAEDLRRDGGASTTVLVTWQMSFDHIRSRPEQASAADLLALMSFFDRQGIPEWALKGASPPGVKPAEHEPDSDSESGRGDTEDTFDDDIATLLEYCLIMTNQAGTEFEMHSLVQLSTREWLADSGQQETVRQQFIERMAAACPWPYYKCWPVCEILSPHIQVAIDYRPDEERIEQWTILLYKGGYFAYAQGRYDIAERLARKALETAEKLLGKMHFATLEIMGLLAVSIQESGQLEEAEKIQMEVLKLRKRTIGAHNLETLRSMNSLAQTYSHQGRWNEAENLFTEVLDGRRTVLQEDDPAILETMVNLASIYHWQGRGKKVEDILTKVIETCKAKFGADHLETLRSMSCLGASYFMQGRLEEVEILAKKMMETYRSWLGSESFYTLEAMAYLALTWRRMGRGLDAMALMKTCHETSQRAMGPDHPRTVKYIKWLQEWES